MSTTIILSRKKKLLFGGFAMVIGIVAASLLMELALRIHPPPWLQARMEAINLEPTALQFGSDGGWDIEKSDGKFVRFKPYSHFKINYYEYRSQVNIDRWGGRVVNGNRDRQGKQIVPFLGDSFMLGVGVDDNQTFVSLLNADTPYQYLNLGVLGSALPQHLDILEMRLHEFHSPKVCVFSFYTGNDYTDIIKYYKRSKDDSRRATLFLNVIQFFIRHFHFLGRSYAVEFCEQVAMNVQGQAQGEHRAWSMETPSGKRLANPTMLLMYKKASFRDEAIAFLGKSLDRLQTLARKENFLPVFIIIPEKHQVDPQFLAARVAAYGIDPEDMDRQLPDTIAAGELRKRGIVHFDLFSCLDQKKGMYYRIDDHLTPAGCRQAAKCLRDLNSLIASTEK